MAKVKFPKKCRYAHCKHNGIINEFDEYVNNGSSWFHADCRAESDTIKRIIDTFVKKVNPNCVVVKLRAVINTIIYTRGNSAEFLEFALNYAISHGSKLYEPPGLYYIVQDYKVKKAWDVKQEAENRKKLSNMGKMIEDSQEPSFIHTKDRMDILDSLFGGADGK